MPETHVFYFVLDWIAECKPVESWRAWGAMLALASLMIGLFFVVLEADRHQRRRR